ncbi:uncharacterized protein B0H18DRAFT_31247 [Fomitopsis serialis]|uniref:uncharacterized protein n=1 Tax=Fomitopsis serialis TaxID=139415 RepID=UPI002008AA3F|nr:uncharacterized protein B0H18DRAFT_31247 [Neoantrodia serialis]KAH9932593.1 hypothetical protein B0H18DRAFT_31247 [Neoantrodia serialis]
MAGSNSQLLAAQFDAIASIIAGVEGKHRPLAQVASAEQKRACAHELYKRAVAIFDMLKWDTAANDKARWKALRDRAELMKDESMTKYLNAADALWRFTVPIARDAFHRHSLYLNPKMKAQANARPASDRLSAPAYNTAPRLNACRWQECACETLDIGPQPLWYYSPRPPDKCLLPTHRRGCHLGFHRPLGRRHLYPIPIMQYY